MEKTAERLEIIINAGSCTEDSMIQALERVLELMKQGNMSGADVGWSWDYRNCYDFEEDR